MNLRQHIFPGARIVGHALFLEKHNCLTISDLHIGIESYYNSQGVMIPRINYQKIRQILKKIFQETGKLNKIIINGDLKHEFGSISKQEWQEIIELIRFMKKHSKEIVIIKGNHDVMLQPITGWEKIKIVKEHYFPKEKIIIVHGDKIPESKEYREAKKIIIGNEHPAIKIRDKQAVETYKCFLKGRFQEKTIVVLPSLNQVTKGTNILSQKMISPFLKQDLSEFKVWVVEDQAYYFGRVKNLY